MLFKLKILRKFSRLLENLWFWAYSPKRKTLRKIYNFFRKKHCKFDLSKILYLDQETKFSSHDVRQEYWASRLDNYGTLYSRRLAKWVRKQDPSLYLFLDIQKKDKERYKFKILNCIRKIRKYDV